VEKKATELVGAIDQQLMLMREGRNAPLQFKIGGALIPCRVITGDEVVRIEQDVVLARERLDDENPATEQWYQHAIRKAFLVAATTIKEGEPPALTPMLLSAMSNDEVLFAYRAYTELLAQVSPLFEMLSEDQFEVLKDAVKKTPWLLRECTSAQLAAALARVWELDPADLLQDKFSG
jgi:hypothetical protein